MPRPSISVTIITLNEEENIARAIQSVKWADEVLIVDSGSTDRTLSIAQDLGARVVQNPWPGYGKQKNFAQSIAKYDWVLNIDADEAIPAASQNEILQFMDKIGDGTSEARGFLFPRKTFYLGRWIKHGGWYPNYLARMADRRYAAWTEPNVHEELVIQGATERMSEPLHHYTFSDIQDQILTNLRYSKFGFQELQKRGQKASLMKLIFKPIGKFAETYFLKRGFMDGLPGFIISINAAHSMFLKYAYLIEAEIDHNARSHHR